MSKAETIKVGVVQVATDDNIPTAERVDDVVQAEQIDPRFAATQAQLVAELHEKSRVQEKAFNELKPALDALKQSGYEGTKTAVLDFSIESRSCPRCELEYCSEHWSINKCSVTTVFKGESVKDWTLSNKQPPDFNYRNQWDATAELRTLEGALLKPQEVRLADYIERCRKEGQAINDAFLRLVVEVSEKKKLDAVAFQQGNQVGVVTKKDMKEYKALEDTISTCYSNREKRARPLLSKAGVLLGLGIGLPVATYYFGFVFGVILSVTPKGFTVAIKSFTANPAVYGTLLAVMAVLVISAIVLYAEGGKRLKADKLKYSLPACVTVWRGEQMKQQLKEARDAQKVDPVVAKVEM